MNHNYIATPTFACTHVGWWVDGEHIPLIYQTACPAHVKLKVSFGYKPIVVKAILRTIENGRINNYYLPAIEE